MNGEELGSPEALHDVLSVMVDMVSIHDVDGIYLYTSPSCRELLGYEPEELVGRSAYELFHPEDLDAIQRSHDTVAETTDGSRIVYRIRCADGTYTWFETTSRSLHTAEGEPERIVTVSRDVSDRVEAEQRFELAVEHAPIGMAVVDLDGTWLHANPALCDLLGYDASELATSTFQDITVAEDLETDVHLVTECLAGLRDGYDIEKRYIDSSGAQIWAHLTVALVRGPGGQPRYFISQIVDITARKLAERRLEERALSDPLTGLPNRDAARRIIRDVLRATDPSPSAVLFCDLDGFKQINDELGHGVGDEVLVAVAHRISRAVRPTDAVARLGGDEFVVVCPGVGVPDKVRRIANRIRTAVDRPLDVKGSVLSVGVSVGAQMVSPRSGHSVDDIIELADQAMYEAKAGSGIEVRVAERTPVGAGEAVAADTTRNGPDPIRSDPSVVWSGPASIR